MLLLQYVKAGLVEECKTILGQMAPGSRLKVVERQDRHGRGAVHHAALRSKVSVLKLVLGLGADCNAIDVKGNRPLHLCSCLAVARVLVEAGAGLRLQNAQGKTPVQFIEFVGVEDDTLINYLRHTEQGSENLPTFATLMTNGLLSAVMFAAVLAGAVAYYLALHEDDETFFRHDDL
jgi:hypothetical protein